MEMAIKKEIYEQLAPIWSGTAGKEVTEDCIVPDTMPDAAAVLDAEGYITLRSKEAEPGGVQLSVNLSAWVLYAPEDGGLPRSLELTLPVEIRMEAQGVETECIPVAKLRIRNLEARAVNSRKITLRADLEAEAQCFRRQVLAIPVSLETEDRSVHIREQRAEVMLVSDVREKTFVATDEYALPPGCASVGGILSRRTEAVLDDVKYVGGKTVFRGRILSELLLTGEDGGLFPGKYETEFSQIMEMDGGDGDASTQVVLMLTGVFYDLPEYGREQSRIGAEIHVAAQCVCRPRREIVYMGDLYSTCRELMPSAEALSLPVEARPVSVRQTVAGRAEPVPAEGELVRTCASIGGISLEGSSVKTSVSVRLLFRDGEGKYTSVRNRMPVEFTVSELLSGASLRDVSVSITDVYCGTGAGGADVRIVLQMDAISLTERPVEAVNEVTEGEARSRSASVIMVRMPANGDIWALAKRYGSTVEAIREANEGRGEGLLLVPRTR